MQIHLTYASFFEAKQDCPKVEDLLYYCIAHKLSLRVNLCPAGVLLSAPHTGQTHRVLSLTGRWRSTLLEGAYDSAALMLVPFILLIEDLFLPPGSLYTLGRGNRSVADLFMRNFFFAACRCEQMTIHTAAVGSNAAVFKGSHGLTWTYLQIVRAYLKDNVFDRSNAPELIVACAHLPLLRFSNPLIEAGAADLRRVSAQASRPDRLSEQRFAYAEPPERMPGTWRT